MIMKKILVILMVVALVSMGMVGCSKQAQEKTSETQQSVGAEKWVPEKEITFIIPFEAGGTADVPARVMVKYMNKYSDKPFNVINLPGSGGRVGAKKTMNSKPDGYTVVHVPTGWYMQKAMEIADFSYEDFEPVSLWAQSWLALVVKADSQYETFQDLINEAKARPGEIKMGGVSGTLPILAELTILDKTTTDFDMVSIDPNGKAAELLSGRIETYVDGFGALKPYIDSGDFRCLGVFSQKPLPGYEDIPLMSDIGVPDSEFLDQVFGMWAPKGTPDAALDYINNVIKQAANDPECIAELNKLSFAPMHTTRDEYMKILEKSQNDTNEAVKPLLEDK